jgi:hypothetical protein
VWERATGTASAERHTGLHRRRGERPSLTAQGQVLTENFGFPSKFAFHQLLHIH